MDKKITVKVLIENDQVYVEEFVIIQPLHVITNRADAHFKLSHSDQRILRREDGTQLTDLHMKIGEAAIRNGETLRYVKSAPKPVRDKGFANG